MDFWARWLRRLLIFLLLSLVPRLQLAHSLLAFVGQYRWLAIWLLAPLPMLAIHFRNLWERPQHQYFPIVLAAAWLLFWTRLVPAEEDEFEKKHWILQLVLAASLLTLALGTWVVFSPWLASVAFVLAAGAAMMVVAERYHVANLFGIWVLLWLLVPLPSVYEQQLSQFLQRATTVVSGAALDRIGLPNLVEGTTLMIPGQHLFIEEACTGIVSMMSVIACCLILAVWANRAWLHTILLVLAGLVLVSVTNIVRIVTLAIADVWLEIDLTTGWQHDLLGVCLFGIAILLALSTDRVLHFLLAPITRTYEDVLEEESWWTRAFNAVAYLGAPAATDVEAESAGNRRTGGLADKFAAVGDPVCVAGGEQRVCDCQPRYIGTQFGRTGIRTRR